MYSLPTSVQIGQVSFNIRNQGDYRVILDCFQALNDDELTKEEKIFNCLFIFYEDFYDLDDLPKDSETLNQCVLEMFKFFNQNEELQSNTHDVRLLDWDSDSNLIASAINKVANQEIRSLEYLHWWTFLGYYIAIGECPLSHIVGIRSKIANNQKLEDHEKKFKQENPQYFNIDMRSAEQKEADDYIRKLWGEA